MSAPQTDPGRDAGAVWLVTGCSSGFGRALSAALHTRATPLVATARDLAALDHLPDDDPTVLKATLDVTKLDTIATAFNAAMQRFGHVDVVVNNAGIGVIGPVEDVTEYQAREQFETNVFGLMAVTRAAQPIFREQRRGVFINFASMAGEASVPSLGIYSASKFAVEGYSEALSQEMAPYGVRVLIVEPGPFDTQWIGKNAVWAERTDRYPAVWEHIAEMKAAYADRAIVGDPVRAVAAILRAVAIEDAPLRLPLHEASVASTRGKLAAVAIDLDRMEPLAREVHYDN